MSLLSVRGLAKAFEGVVAVDGIDLDLEGGEILALIGPNGAGKSTCFNMLNGQLRPDRGTVCFDGRSLVGMTPRAIWRLGIGRTFQITATFGSMTVRENVQTVLMSWAGETRSVWRRGADRHGVAAGRLLEAVGMVDQAERPCGVLAYGDLKRLELAIALANEPRLLLMDEPTAGMASQDRFALMDLVVSIVRERGISVLFVEHDMDVVFGHADRVLVMNRGALISEGTPDVVRNDPTVQAVYLGAGSMYGASPAGADA